MQNPKYVLHSLYVLKNHVNHPKVLNILEFIWCSYKVLIKNSKFLLHSLYFFDISQNHPKCLLFLNLLVSSYK